MTTKTKKIEKPVVDQPAITLLGDFLLCRTLNPDELSAGGIVLPESATKKRHNESVVLVAGPGLEGRKMNVAVGQTIVHRGTGETFEFEGRTLCLVHEADVIGTVPKRV